MALLSKIEKDTYFSVTEWQGRGRGLYNFFVDCCTAYVIMVVTI